MRSEKHSKQETPTTATNSGSLLMTNQEQYLQIIGDKNREIANLKLENMDL